MIVGEEQGDIGPDVLPYLPEVGGCDRERDCHHAFDTSSALDRRHASDADLRDLSHPALDERGNSNTEESFLDKIGTEFGVRRLLSINVHTHLVAANLAE